MIPTSRTRSNSLLTAIALSALVALAVSGTAATAAERRDGGHQSDHRDRDRDRHRGGHRDHWDRDGYYPPPPVVYGSPYYAPPPVVYGPSVGFYLPGISIGIH